MKYFIECTHTYHTRMNSGIQRVVRNIVRASASSDVADEIVPVIFEGDRFSAVDKHIPYPSAGDQAPRRAKGKLARAKRLLVGAFQAFRKGLAKLIPYEPFVIFLYAPRTQWGLSRVLLLPFGLAPKITPAPARPEIHVEKGDVLVLLDSSWHLNLWNAVDACKQKGALVVVVLYDLIPHTHPQFCVVALAHSFNKWLRHAASRADAVVAISETVALEFQRTFPRIAGPGRALPAVSHFWLGSELDGAQSHGQPIEPEVLQVCSSGRPNYVYVSTIEPRKNHAYALSAFEILWKKGIQANFMIIGRVGWKCDDFIQRVRKHEQFGKQLFMFHALDDNQLAYIYDHVNGLVFTSLAEGFGLPVVEGLQRGLPVFASDIPVFREIGRQGVQFVDLSDPASLADAVSRHIDQGAPRLQAPVSWLSWEESTQQLFARIDEGLAPHRQARHTPRLPSEAPATAQV